MTYVTFQYYNEKSNRLAIFGEVVNNNIAITVIPCAKKDSFKKKKARELYQDIKDGKSVRYETYIANGDDFHAFLRWCRNTYYRKMTLIFDEKSHVFNYIPRRKNQKGKIEVLTKIGGI